MCGVLPNPLSTALAEIHGAKDAGRESDSAFTKYLLGVHP